MESHYTLYESVVKLIIMVRLAEYAYPTAKECSKGIAEGSSSLRNLGLGETIHALQAYSLMG